MLHSPHPKSLEWCRQDRLQAKAAHAVAILCPSPFPHRSRTFLLTLYLLSPSPSSQILIAYSPRTGSTTIRYGLLAVNAGLAPARSHDKYLPPLSQLLHTLLLLSVHWLFRTTALLSWSPLSLTGLSHHRMVLLFTLLAPIRRVHDPSGLPFFYFRPVRAMSSRLNR